MRDARRLKLSSGALVATAAALMLCAVPGSTAHPLANDCRPIVRRQLVSNGEGTAPTGPLSTPESAGYSCDASSCQLPDCHCASTSPPGGLNPRDVPQFVTFTSDDAMQSYTLEVLNYLFAERQNPNGCPVKTTFFNSLQYNNFSMVTDFYVAGNEVADHTMSHAGSPNASEITGNLRALNAFSGIPLSSLSGFRAPRLEFTAETLQHLHDADFLYDSSATAATPADADVTDAYWPYTLDNGLANNCLDVQNVCRGQLKLPGLWEIPMYAVFETDSTAGTGIHLMDPWLDASNASTAMEWMRNSFNAHYNGNRQPFGIYSHPIHLAVGYPGVVDPVETREALRGFLEWVQTHDDVYFVTNQQLLNWMRNPVPASQMRSSSIVACSMPDVPADLKICNGIPQNQVGLLEQCAFYDFPWTTCYGCPGLPPGPNNPVPAPNNTGVAQRFRLPSNCSTPFWDPVAGRCLCESDSCSFTDAARPIESSSPSAVPSSSASASSPTAIPRQQSTAHKSSGLQYGYSVCAIAASIAIARWA